MAIKTLADRNNLVEENIHFADQIAYKKQRNMRAYGIQLDELKSAAYLGLIDAANKFNPDKQVSFKAYAYFRINGEINDYLRGAGWGKRNNRISMGSLNSAIKNEDDVAGKTTILDTLICSYQDDSFNKKEFLKKLTKGLPIRYKKIIKLYFINGLTMSQISGKLGVCESRISQLLKECCEKIYNVWTNKRHEIWEELPTNFDKNNRTNYNKLSNFRK